MTRSLAIALALLVTPAAHAATAGPATTSGSVELARRWSVTVAPHFKTKLWYTWDGHPTPMTEEEIGLEYRARPTVAATFGAGISQPLGGQCQFDCGMWLRSGVRLYPLAARGLGWYVGGSLRGGLSSITGPGSTQTVSALGTTSVTSGPDSHVPLPWVDLEADAGYRHTFQSGLVLEGGAGLDFSGPKLTAGAGWAF